MAFGLLSGTPLSMLFSLLLMQGISLTMFRALVNQAITRVDPLKFNFALGNLGPPNTTMVTPATSNSVPTPAPIIDPRVLDLITLIRAIQPPGQETQQQSQSSARLTAAPSLTPIIALPLPAVQSPAQALTASGLLGTQVVGSTPTTSTGLPAQAQIIIVPQLMKTSASETIEDKVEIPNEETSQIESPRKVEGKRKRKKTRTYEKEGDKEEETIVFQAVSLDPAKHQQESL